jgi:hypothetical protein
MRFHGCREKGVTSESTKSPRGSARLIVHDDDDDDDDGEGDNTARENASHQDSASVPLRFASGDGTDEWPPGSSWAPR